MLEKNLHKPIIPQHNIPVGTVSFLNIVTILVFLRAEV